MSCYMSGNTFRASLTSESCGLQVGAVLHPHIAPVLNMLAPIGILPVAASLNADGVHGSARLPPQPAALVLAPVGQVGAVLPGASSRGSDDGGAVCPRPSEAFTGKTASIRAVWEEHTVGIERRPSLRALDRVWGTAWREKFPRTLQQAWGKHEQIMERVELYAEKLHAADPSLSTKDAEEVAVQILEAEQEQTGLACRPFREKFLQKAQTFKLRGDSGLSRKLADMAAHLQQLAGMCP